MRKITLIAVAALVFPSTAAPVCSVPQPRLVCAEYFQEQVVVIAKLVRTKHVLPKDGLDGHSYTLSVQRTLRGRIAPTFRVWEENSSGRAPFEWVNGKSYLLFLWFSKEDRNSWVLDGCGNSAPASEAGKTLKTIEQINAGKKGGFVSGNVAADSISSPLEGVSVLVRGNGHTYKTISKKDGSFSIRVPAGTYVANARQPHWLFRADELTYEDPQKISISNGGCAQVQFIGKQSRR